MNYATEQSVLNAQWNAAYSTDITAQEQRRPFMLLKPKMYMDGNVWCALYGDNIQEGVCGFGNTPHAASIEFDKAWMGDRI